MSVVVSRLLRIEHLQDDLEVFNTLLDERTNAACRELEGREEVVNRIKRETYTLERQHEVYIIGFATIFSFTPDEEYQQETTEDADPHDTRRPPRPFLPFPAEPEHITEGLL